MSEELYKVWSVMASRPAPLPSAVVTPLACVSVLRLQVFLEFADNVQAVSCDEALLDVSSRVVDAEQILGHAQRIREAIAQRTGCQASIGAAHNILLAKYA